MNNSVFDIWSTYLGKIDASVGSLLFQHVYVKTDGVSVDVTRAGELSCAAHVSSVLAMVGLIDQPHATVASTLKALLSAGWTESARPEPGSIVLWPQSSDGHDHIGFYVNEHEVVSNSTRDHVPVRHQLVLEDGRHPSYFLNYEGSRLLDTRNVVDKYRGQPMEAIINDLDSSRSELEIAVENLERDFNMGTVVRNANAFNVRKVHVVGRRQWNKRGAMKTDAYLHIEYHETPKDFYEAMQQSGREIIAMDIVEGAQELHSVELPKNAVLIFGAEGPGLSQEVLQYASKIVKIEQFGSTRSVNVGVASGIAMYAWIQQHRLG